MKYRLLPFLAGAITRTLAITNPKGGFLFVPNQEFLPNTDYETTDPAVISYIKGTSGDVREKLLLDKTLKGYLEEYNIKYETIVCSSCQGSNPRALFNPFQILEDN